MYLFLRLLPVGTHHQDADWTAGLLCTRGDRHSRAEETGERTDYLNFVPEGEPTLDIRLGREIDLLRPLGIGTAVIINGSLTWRRDMREDLMGADYVSLIETAIEEGEDALVWITIP